MDYKLPEYSKKGSIIKFRENFRARDVAFVRRFGSVKEVIISPYFWPLKKICTGWPKDQEEGIAVLCAMLGKSLTNGDLNIFNSWAGLDDKNKSGTMGINERRFMNICLADDWEEFFRHMEIGVKLLMQRTKEFSWSYLIDIIKFRADTFADPFGYDSVDRFPAVMTWLFYEHKRKEK